MKNRTKKLSELVLLSYTYMLRFHTKCKLTEANLKNIMCVELVMQICHSLEPDINFSRHQRSAEIAQLNSMNLG